MGIVAGILGMAAFPGVAFVNGCLAGLVLERSRRACLSFGIGFLPVSIVPVWFVGLQALSETGFTDTVPYFLVATVPWFALAGLIGTALMKRRGAHHSPWLGAAGFGTGAVVSAIASGAVMAAQPEYGLSVWQTTLPLLIAYAGPQIIGIAVLRRDSVWRPGEDSNPRPAA